MIRGLRLSPKRRLLAFVLGILGCLDASHIRCEEASSVLPRRSQTFADGVADPVTAPDAQGDDQGQSALQPQAPRLQINHCAPLGGRPREENHELLVAQDRVGRVDVAGASPLPAREHGQDARGTRQFQFDRALARPPVIDRYALQATHTAGGTAQLGSAPPPEMGASLENRPSSEAHPSPLTSRPMAALSFELDNEQVSPSPPAERHSSAVRLIALQSFAAGVLVSLFLVVIALLLVVLTNGRAAAGQAVPPSQAQPAMHSAAKESPVIVEDCQTTAPRKQPRPARSKVVTDQPKASIQDRSGPAGVFQQILEENIQLRRVFCGDAAA
jgi:hypothetical protein